MYTGQPIIIYGSCYVNQELFYKCLIPLKRLRTYCAGIFNNCDRKSILTLMDVKFSSVNPRSESRKYSCIIHISEDTATSNKIEPRHEISNNVVCATSKDSDQPAHTRSLIRAFASRLNIL